LKVVVFATKSVGATVTANCTGCDIHAARYAVETVNGFKKRIKALF
jgi:hypothetical protein